MTEEQNLKIMSECCRFAKCSANICSLDSDSHFRNRIPSDEKCGVAKSIRLKIGQKHGLEKMGLSDREWAARNIWEGKSEEDKKKIRDEARERLAKYRSQPGG